MKATFLLIMIMAGSLCSANGQTVTQIKYQNDSSYYTGEIIDGKLDGQLKYFDRDGNLLEEGEYKDGDLNGEGKEYNNGQLIMEGRYEMGKRVYGTYYFEGGVTYTGDFQNGVQHGKGVMKWPSGETMYEGDWQNGMKSGYGKFYYPDGNVYEGQFADNDLNGQGKFSLVAGDWAEGTFMNGVLNGPGKYYDTTGKLRYEGEFENGYYKKGTSWYPDGSRYEGEFRAYERWGEGTLYYPDGWVYKGKFAYDTINGYGSLLDEKGNLIFRGYTIEGERIGKGVLVFEDGSWYEGDFFEGKKHGFGKTYNKKDKLLFDGIFIEDQQVMGEIQEYRHQYTSTVDKGQMADGKMNGYGKSFYANNLKYEGMWKDGLRHGRGMSHVYGNKVICNFINNWEEGPGKIYSRDWILIFEGSFLKGQKNGQGTAYNYDGTLKYEGEFAGGEYVKGKRYHKDGGWYEGEFKEFKPHGQGKEFDAQGNLVFEGVFNEGERVE
jgi:hypothetical protein